MNKLITLTFFLLIMNNLSGQTETVRDDREISSFPPTIIQQLNKMGVDDSPILNEYESEYFNFFYKDSRKDFGFSEKKIGFMFSRRISDKKTYFEKERDYQKNNSTTISAFLVLFDENQKIESGGYDAFIVYWSKFSISNEDLLQIVKKNNRKTKNQ